MQTECPHCGNEFDVLDRLAGRRVRCPRCGERFRAEAKGTKPSVAGEGAAAGARTVGHFFTRDVGIVIGGVVVVGIILGALVVRMWFDHQARSEQQAILQEALANKEAGDQFRTRQEYAKALEKYSEAQNRLDRLDVPDRRLQRELEAALQSDEMKYLAQGMVQFRGQWVTEKDKEATLAQEQGLVEFDGRWVKPEELAKLQEEKQKSEEAARLAVEEATLGPEAKAKGVEVVEAFLEYARRKAPTEAAERYLYKLTDQPCEYPKVVTEYAVDQEVASVFRDPKAPEPRVSATFCAVKAYVTIGSVIGPQRVVWDFQVRKVDNEWKITYSKQREAGQPSTPPTPAAPEGQPATP